MRSPNAAFIIPTGVQNLLVNLFNKRNDYADGPHILTVLLDSGAELTFALIRVSILFPFYNISGKEFRVFQRRTPADLTTYSQILRLYSRLLYKSFCSDVYKNLHLCAFKPVFMWFGDDDMNFFGSQMTRDKIRFLSDRRCRQRKG